jgi:hypothetical protein
MGDLHRFARAKKRRLFGMLVYSLLILALFIIQVLYEWNHPHQRFPYQDVLIIGFLIMIVAISALVAWDRIRLKALTRRDPPLPLALKDERAEFNWLRACRLSFFVILAIQILSKLPIMIWRIPWDVPAQSALSLSAAAATSIAAFLGYDRGRDHE